MTGGVRIIGAIMYGLLMLADAYMEISGRYVRANVHTPSFPYCETNRIANASLWGVLHLVIVLWILDDTFLDWAYTPAVFLVWFTILAMKRLWRVAKSVSPSPKTDTPK